MRREVKLEDITDGKFYNSNDLVKAGCNDCMGCFACCKGMGNSLVLDPYDIYQITNGMNISFMELLEGYVQLNVVDGVILPNMAMTGDDEACRFLNAEGRCSIHSIRPGICRMFPLGRYYENGGFSYILQTNECKKQNRTKVKVKSFLGIENIKEYENYIVNWHYFIKDMEMCIRKAMEKSEDEAKALTMELLNTFFIMPYESGQFYSEYYKRVEKMRKKCELE